jgi:polar amino acid transport system substrate-binding protein
MIKRLLAAGLTTFATLLTGCSTAPTGAPAEVRQALAPTGTLRIGVFTGTPSQMIRDSATGEARGVAYELGRAFAQRLNVPFDVIALRPAEFNDAMKTGRVDFGAVGATPARAAIMDFAQPHLQVEAGFLVSPESSILTIGNVDRKGVRVGVTRGSTTEARFSRELKNAVLVSAPSIEEAIKMLAQRQMDVYATNKANLFEMADKLPGFRVLDGRFDVERFSIAVPKGRDIGMPFLRQFVEHAKTTGLVEAAAQRAGLRGLAKDLP